MDIVTYTMTGMNVVKLTGNARVPKSVGSVGAQVVPEHAACPASDTRAHHGWANGSEFVAQEGLFRVVA